MVDIVSVIGFCFGKRCDFLYLLYKEIIGLRRTAAAKGAVEEVSCTCSLPRIPTYLYCHVQRLIGKYVIIN